MSLSIVLKSFQSSFPRFYSLGTCTSFNQSSFYLKGKIHCAALSSRNLSKDHVLYFSSYTLLPIGGTVWHIVQQGQVRIFIIHPMKQCDLNNCICNSSALSLRLWRLPTNLSVCQVTYEPPCCEFLPVIPKTTSTCLICTRLHTHSVIHELAEDKKVQMLHWSP